MYFEPAFLNPNGRTYYVDGKTFSTVQAAVNAAEASANSLGDLIGVTVKVPGGLWAEDVTIRKNVHIVGDGLDMTTIQSITYRPVDATTVAGINRISHCTLQALNGDNETSAGSGIRNPAFYGSLNVIVSYCAVQMVNLLNTDTVFIKHSVVGNHGATDIQLTNSGLRLYYCEVVGDIINNVDNSRADLPTAVGSVFQTLEFQFCMCISIVHLNTLGTVDDPANFSSTDSWVLELDDGDKTQVNFSGGHLDFRVQTGTTHLGTQYNTASPYTPAVPSDWSSTLPDNSDTAIDAVAARLKQAIDNAYYLGLVL
jgi:hypothetical protein